MAVRLPGGMLSLLYGYGKLIVLALCRGKNRHEYLCPGAEPNRVALAKSFAGWC